jgi:hypothetical protein
MFAGEQRAAWAMTIGIGLEGRDSYSEGHYPTSVIASFAS